MNIDERDAVASQFAVSPVQVERDHLISHLLGFLADRFGDRIHFIGGTALARAHLPLGRLSEDIDLIAVGARSTLVEELDSALPRAAAHAHGRLEWAPSLRTVRESTAAVLRTGSGLSVKVQLLSPQGRPPWPTERRTLVQRYSDAPPAILAVPTLPAFVAAKTAAWHDRRAARDLWDLWALNEIGAITAEAGDLYRRHGPTNRLPPPSLFNNPPDEEQWVTQLAGQTRLEVTAEEAARRVQSSWAQISPPEGR